ncbi:MULTISPECIES: hypothetical protein [unclassified Tardiphaga]|uniref:hypothetical protein n=1 Tax=unclassified Tardiphaga TaxID=2631404 RepID=UPI001FF056CD|nr:MULTISPECIES: hypothetical protein [unclassified Tardiphaga]
MSSTASSTTGLVFIPASTHFETKLTTARPLVNMISNDYYFVGKVNMSARETAALLLQAARIMQGEGYYGEVSPAQWMALRFFAGAKLSRTPSAFAEQSITRGTATQRHQSACGRRLPAPAEVGDRWTQRQSATDRQWSRCTRRDPFEVLMRGVAAPDTKQRAAVHALQQVLTAVAASGSHRRFGVCRDCCYIGGDICCSLTNMPSSVLECLLLGVPMQPDETELPCVKLSAKERARS